MLEYQVTTGFSKQSCIRKLDIPGHAFHPEQSLYCIFLMYLSLKSIVKINFFFFFAVYEMFLFSIGEIVI
jgi:hypothetical protein